MKVLALGCGDMGRFAVSALLSSPHISQVTVADMNEQLVDKFVELAGSDKLVGRAVDVTNTAELQKLMRAHDLVTNTVGPFFKFGKLILESAIQTKTSYVDICDDWKPTMELLELDNDAKEAGVTAVIGMGASPGMLNLLALQASSRFEKVDEVVTAWGLGNAISGDKLPHHVSKKMLPATKQTSAVYQHLLHQCTGEIPTYQDGQATEIQSLTEIAPLKVPGYEDVYAAHIGHPEPVTLPRTIKAQSVSNVFYYGKKGIDLLRGYGQDIENEKITLDEASEKLAEELNESLGRDEGAFYLLQHFPMSLFVSVTGSKDGVKKRATLGLKREPYGGMAGVTGVPLAIVAGMILTGEVNKKGVLTPEEAVEPEAFFERYAPYCGDNLTVQEVLFDKEVEC